MLRKNLRIVFFVMALAAGLLAACGGGGWDHIVVPTDPPYSTKCVSKCLRKGSAYKCLEKCPGGISARGRSCKEAVDALYAGGWTYGGGYQCESSR